MAVSVEARSRVHVPQQVATLSPAVLLLTLVAPALDLLAIVQHAPGVPTMGALATAAASAVLLVNWVRFSRASWLAAASLAGFASLVMRLVGADVAPALSLLMVIGLGLGGAFAPPARPNAHAWLD
jgi:hypothetical protein